MKKEKNRSNSFLKDIKSIRWGKFLGSDGVLVKFVKVVVITVIATSILYGFEVLIRTILGGVM